MDCHGTNHRSDLDKRAHFREDPAVHYCNFVRGWVHARVRKGSQILFFFSRSKSEDANHFMEKCKALISRKVNTRTRTGEWR